MLRDCEILHLPDALIFTLVVTLALVIYINQPTRKAESVTEICINRKCKMASKYEGYHSQNTRINDNCRIDKTGTNSNDNSNDKVY